MEDYLKDIQTALFQKSPTYIKVKIIPKSPTTEIVDQMEDGTYKIRVAAMPVQGKANEALCKYLKKTLRVSQVTIISGGRDAVKLVRIDL